MIESSKVHKILYGGDYNPEQWPEEIWKEDMRLFKLAHIDVVTLNVFSWAALQPDEITYDFSKLDKIMEYVKENGLKVCFATSTGAHPAWMARKYPDILRVGHNGMKRKFGARHNSCPNSPTYRKYSVALAAKLAERYKDYDNIVAWHISNEYGGECYCENCEKAFRVWLHKKYGTLDELNRVWNTSFWGHTFYDWDDVVLPDMRSEEFKGWHPYQFPGDFTRLPQIQFGQYLRLLQIRARCGKRVHAGYSGYHKSDGILSIIRLPEMGKRNGFYFLGQLSFLWRRDRKQCDGT